MAIEKCPECGNQISSKASFCPHCGAPYSKYQDRSVGVLVYENGDRYEGEIIGTLRDGHGTYYWPDGLKYEGEFRENLRHGPGKYIDVDGYEDIQQWDHGIQSI